MAMASFLSHPGAGEMCWAHLQSGSVLGSGADHGYAVVRMVASPRYIV